MRCGHWVDRHSVFLSWFIGSATRRILATFDEAARELTAHLATRIDRLSPLDRQAAGRGGVTSRPLDAMIKDIRSQANNLRSELLRVHKAELRGQTTAMWWRDLVARRSLGLDSVVRLDWLKKTLPHKLYAG